MEPPPREPYDPSPLDAEKARKRREFERILAQHTQAANDSYDSSIQRSDNPAVQAEIENARQNALAMMRANHRDALAQLDALYTRLHREARAEHDARQRDMAELAELEFSNELQRYELECQ